MPETRVSFHPSAVAEATAARDWYAERNTSAARSFLDELDHAVSQVAKNPKLWAKYELGTRRYVFPRFPFSLIYRQVKGSVEVIAVAHQRRKPGYWQSRN